MIFNVKCVFLGLSTRTSKEGKTFNILKVLTRPDNENVELFLPDRSIEKFKNLKDFQTLDLNLNLYKDSKNLYRLGLAE